MQFLWYPDDRPFQSFWLNWFFFYQNIDYNVQTNNLQLTNIDWTDHEILTAKMHAYGFDTKSLKFIKNTSPEEHRR